MKKFFFGMTLLGGLTLAAADPYFGATIKHVDQGGEMLSYSNLTVPMVSCNDLLTNLGKAAKPDDPVAQDLCAVFARMLDLTSFKAMAQSSVEAEKGLYIYKQFVLTDKNTKSVLSAKALQNGKLDHMISSLPADTRLALCGNFNMSYILKRLTEEFAASGNQEMIDGLAKLRTEAKTKGMDIDAWAASACGPMILVVSGKTPLEMKIVIGIADKDGVLSTLLRRKYQPKEGESSFPITGLDYFPKAQLVYSNGCILLVSDPKILEKPEKMLGSVPRYGKYLSLLPKEGTGFIIIDITPGFADIINAMIPEDQRSITVKPISLAAVDFCSEEGIACTIVSDFSLPMSWTGIIDAIIPKIMAQTKAAAKANAPAAPAAPKAAPAKAPAGTVK